MAGQAVNLDAHINIFFPSCIETEKNIYREEDPGIISGFQ